MATEHLTPHVTPHVTGPNSPEAFIADRQVFWSHFTHAIVYAVAALVLLLIGMAIFLT